MRFARRLARAAGALLIFCSICSARPNMGAKPAPKPAFTETQLEKLSRALKQPNSATAYSQLSAFASRKSSGKLGSRAALALGYFDYGKGHYAQASKWLARAYSDPLVADYALYWLAETDLALGRSADALVEFKRFRNEYPDSVMTDAALQSLGDAALAANRPAEAVAALDEYSQTTQRPALLLLRGAAREQAGRPLDAVADYQALYMRFATSEQARQAATKLGFLRGSLGESFPPLALDQRLAHAALQFGAKSWGDARNEYATILPELSGADRERAQLRIMECGVALGAAPAEMAALQITDPDVDAERLDSLAEYYRVQQQEAQMVAAVEGVVSRAPSSRWAESALFLAGNYYWVQLDRDRAAGYYKRLEENFPTSPDATSAQWRVAWSAVLKRQPEAATILQDHLRRFPGSPYTPDALYWLGRLAEEAGVAPLARAYYSKLAERYPQNYFQTQASVRVPALGPGPADTPDVLASIPPVSPIPKLDGPIPLAAVGRQARADALRSIGFDASAELELRAGYAATGEPRLLLEAAQAAAVAGHYGAAIVTVRQIFPQLESQLFSDVPRDVWRVAYALPFEASIRRWSAKAGVDPMLVAGLIRQESAFQPEARSGKSAIGLMQLIGPTARLLAKHEKIRYSRAKLVDPDYNVRLGTVYVANLEKQFGGPESALAAYNAGEDRVILWTSGQAYRETAEFVDSIPFTETRQYVQIVTRNADIYRRLYGAQPDEPSPARTRRGR
ncbi:MAG: transglycosylase SLT domain-containing protein [Candidatus Acidoferrales bacterium]|nr:transglycosylase SLT domain-containing protein [Candidatus Acidoferrales bacterium]